MNLLSTATSVIMRLGVFMIGAWMSVSGTDVTPGVVLVFLQLVTFVISPIERIPPRLANRKAAIAIMDKISDFLFENNEISGEEIPLTLSDGISIKDLSFGYENDRHILRHIDLHFQSGKNTLLSAAPVQGKQRR